MSENNKKEQDSTEENIEKNKEPEEEKSLEETTFIFNHIFQSIIIVRRKCNCCSFTLLGFRNFLFFTRRKCFNSLQPEFIGF